MRRFLFVAAVTVLVALGFGTQPAWAVVIHAEVGDAGSLPATAQDVTAGGPLAQITGTLNNGSDVDMFRLCLPGGGTFSATTVGTGGTVFDTMLALFNDTGAGVYLNDDDATSGTFRSTLPSGHPLTPAAPGVYFLAVTSFANFPLDAGGNNIFTAGSGSVLGPHDADPVASWTSNGESGTYVVNITGAASCTQPPPDVLCAELTQAPPGAITGTSGDDVLVGTPGDDVIFAFAGNDRVSGGGGNDTIVAGAGNDRVAGEGGNDLLCGGPGDDSLDGGAGNDDLSGDDGNDNLAGGPGNDRLHGGENRDRLDGGSGTNTNNGGDGASDICVNPAPPNTTNCP